MTPEYQLIQQISQLVANNQLENRAVLEDYATQFAELCRMANERLLRCADYLDKGRRSEAVYEASLSPNLLQLASMLDSFEGLKRWQNICHDLELEMAPALNNAIVERIRTASTSEEELGPLLKEYRRSVYQSDHEKCVILLRRIRERDPQNPSWIENLRPLEEESLPVWIERAERGLEKMDLADLKIVFQELTHPMRVAMAPEALMARLRKALLSERSVDLRAEGKRLMVLLKEAMDAEDVPQMEKLWEKCKALEMDEAFMERPAGWDKVQQDSHDLAESLEKRHLRENEFNQAVSKLKDMLMDNSISGLDLRHEYERLQSMELPIPELLTRQVREVLAHKQAAKRHKAVLISSACVAVVVISVAVIAFVVYALGRREMRNQWLAKAEMFSKNSSYDELTVLMEEVKEKDSELYASPEFVGFRNEMDEKLRLIEKKKRDFNAYKATLEDIRRENYRGDSASIIRTLDDAAAVAIDDEQKDYVIRWKNDWLKFSAVQEQEADSVVLPILNGIQTALTGVRINKGAAIADEQKALEKIQNEFDGKLKANAIAGCSQEVRSKYEQLKGRIVSRIGDAQARLGVWQEETEKEKKNKARIEGKLDNLRRDIASALPDLNRYEALLKNFVELGEGTPESTDYRQMLMQFSEYRKVLSLKGLDIEESISDREVVAQVEKLLSTDNPASSSVWQSDLERLKSLNQVNNELRRKAGTLLNVREGIVYVIKCRRHGEKNWTYYYGEKPFQTQQKDGVIYYWGSVLWASPLESRVAPMTLAELNNGANMNSSEYEVVYSRIKDDNLAEHVKVMKRMVLEAMRSDDVQTLVLKELQKLRNNSEVEPVQAMVIFKKFVTLLASYSTVELPECREWAAAAVAIDTNVPWQNANHPKTLAAREAIKAFWAKIPDFETYIKRLQWNRQLLAAVLGTKLRSVGSIQLNGDGHKVYIPRSRGTELWLYQPGGNGLVPGFKLLPMDEAGNVQEKNLAALPVGCLVFAPYQGREIRPLWRRFVAEDAERVKTLIRPQALPMNID